MRFVDFYCGGIGTRSNKRVDCYFVNGKLNIRFATDSTFCVMKYKLHIDLDSNYFRNWVLIYNHIVEIQVF